MTYCNMHKQLTKLEHCQLHKTLLHEDSAQSPLQMYPFNCYHALQVILLLG
jgi:hypothetical protein